jgi:phosphatidylserine decarboxylase
MGIRPEVIPFVGVAIVFGALIAAAILAFHAPSRGAGLAGVLVALFFSAYFLFFFRDPERRDPVDPSAVVAGAEGKVARIARLSHAEFARAAAFSGLREADVQRFLKSPEIVRISIFLSLFDVHVNRAPIAGNSKFLGYFPGKHFFTFKEKSSDVNQHNSILIGNADTVCLVNQIVGPVARRVVYWPDSTRPVPVARGARIGMMKFGSRLDMYFPADEVDITVHEGQFVRAGETIVARVRK